MKRYFPFLDWMFPYNKSHLRGDITAGLTVGVMLIPQGMAYAMLAGLPPIYGLYASTIPLIIYALMGTSPQLAVGPVAMVALLVSSGVGAIAEIGTTEFVALAILLALMVGLIQFLMGVFRLGFLVNFLSHPVIAGFTSAAAIIIGFSQLKHLLGIHLQKGKVHQLVIQVAERFGETNVPTLILGLSGIVLLLAIKRWAKKIPGPLILVLFSIGLVYLLDLKSAGVKIVGEVPGGLPQLIIPSFKGDNFIALLPVALTIAFVGFMESIAVAKAIQRKHSDYKLSPNQELIALGAANIFGSIFQSFPVTGGFSRTAVNDQSGAKSGLASLISAALIILTLLFLTDYFYYLPKAVLASIIMVAVFGLIDIKEAKHLWKSDRTDFLLFMATAGGTLFLGIEEGIAIGVLLSMVMMIYRVSNPHTAILGKVPDFPIYRNITRFDDLVLPANKLIMRIDSSLYFANIGTIRDRIHRGLETIPEIEQVVLDLSA
ncbi:MAG: sulfate permease, partial [Bacteroidota bacterium]